MNLVQASLPNPASTGELLESLRRNAAWLSSQNEAFKASMNGAPLREALEILIHTALEQSDYECRCAFYIANEEGTELRLVTGMTDSYARCVSRFRIGRDSLACGLAAALGEPVITRDVRDDPRWANWLWMARDYDYRGCWSFPLETASGKVVGTFALYFRDPREPTGRDREVIAALTSSASIIVSRYQESEARAWSDRALRASEADLAAELAATRELQRLSTELLSEQEPQLLYQKLTEAAATIMRSDFASMQSLHPEQGQDGSLLLVASKGFDERTRGFWTWVNPRDSSCCARALATGDRVIVEDVRKCDFIAGTLDEEIFSHAGIRAVQSTPLISRSGQLIGMLSTLWAKPHVPSEAELRRFDILIRQAADLLERAQRESALRRSEEQLRAYLTASFDIVFRTNSDWSAVYRLNGDDPPQAVDRPASSWLEAYVHPDDRPRVRKSLEEAMAASLPLEVEHRTLRADGRTGWMAMRAIPLRAEGGPTLGWMGTATDISQRKQHEEHQRLLVDELNHRVKNTLAMVQSMARQTLRNSADRDQLRAMLEARLGALARAHDILTREQWEGALLGQVVAQALAGVPQPERFDLSGPNLWLAPRQALSLALALHELATNAVKYGALSNDQGRVRIVWTVAGRNGARRFKITWEESGGPRVTPPDRSGFGSRLIERGLGQDLQGEVRLEYRPEGVRCAVEAPLHRGEGYESRD